MSKLGKFAAACAAVCVFFAAGEAWAVDYTWCGGAEGDAANWYNPTNWGKTAVGAYPKSTSDKAIVPENLSAEIALTNSVTIHTLTLNAGCSFSLTGVSTEEGVPQLKLNSGFTDNGVVQFKLDAVSLYRNAAWTPKSGCSVELTNGAELYLTIFYLTVMDSVSLSGGSRMSVSDLQINGAARTLTIDDSTMIVRANGYFGTAAPGGGRIVFKGAHPLLRVGGHFRAYSNVATMTDKMRFDFEVPKGGFAEVPVQACGTVKIMDGRTSVPDGYMQFTVLGTSPAVVEKSSIDFCACLSPQGMLMSKISNGDTTTAALTMTDSSMTEPADADDTAVGIRLRLGEGEPTPAAIHSGNVSDFFLTAVARHVIEATGWISAIATDGSLSTLELWVGEANDASTMTKADSCSLDRIGPKSLTFEAPENVGEKTYYFQFRLLDITGTTTNNLVSTGLFSATTEDRTVYVWKDVDGDWTGAWNDPAHWTTDYATADGYPHTVNATAKFPRGHVIAVTVGDNFTVGTVDLSDNNPFDANDSVDVTFVGAEGEEYGTNKTLTVGTAFDVGTLYGLVAVDRLKMSVPAFSLGTRRTLRLQNSAFVTTGVITGKYGADFEVLSESTLDVNGSFTVATAESSVLIDDGTIAMRGGDFVLGSSDLSGGQVVFAGTHPRLTFAKSRIVNVDMISDDESRTDFRFVIPEGGYETAPISCVDTQTKAFAPYPSKKPKQHLYLSVDPASGCYESVTDFVQPLVDWPGTTAGVIDTTCIYYEELPDGGTFDSEAHLLSVHVVSLTHANRITVSGDAGVTVEGAEPAFGESEMEGAFTLSSPATYERDGVRYTCTGCTLTEIEKTATGTARTSTEHVGTSFAYTPCGKEVEALWHYAVDYKVAATVFNDANGTVAVSDDGYATAAKSVTLTATTKSEDMEFQYWYGDLPYADRYANPLALSGDKVRKVTAFFGRKTGGVCTTFGSNGTFEWYDASQWSEGVVPGTNDTAVLWCTRDDTNNSNNNRRYMVPSFFAVGNLVISNACVLVNAKADTGASNGIKYRVNDQNFGYCFCAPLVNDAAWLEPVGCDIYGDVTVTCRNAMKTSNGGILSVGGQGGQSYSKVTVMGNLTIEDGAVQISAGYPIPAVIDVTKKGEGADMFMPFEHPEEMFRGGNVLRVFGKTTIGTPKSKDSTSNLHVLNDFRSGTAVWLDLQEVEVQAGAAITARQGGYGKFGETGLADSNAYSMCPGGHGANDNTSGGSYGGAGGTDSTAYYPALSPTTRMATYGYATAPYHPGSPNGGEGGCGRRGAGSIRLDCATLDLEGALLAQGIPGSGNKGGSSGGGIWVVCEVFNAGSDAMVFAQGGNSTGSNAGGGGGRIAICEGLAAEQVQELFETEEHLATDVSVSSLAEKLGARFSVAGGSGTTSRSNGFDGTGVYIVNTTGRKTVTIEGDPVNMGEPTPGYGPMVVENGVEITFVAPDDAYVSEDERSRRNCVGFSIADESGAVLTNGVGRTVTYQVTENCTFTWKLTALVHRLETDVSEGGAIETNAIALAGDAWQPDGSTITLTAVPAENRAFAGWYGEIPSDWQAAATLSFPSAMGRTVRALFVTTAEGPAVWTGEGDGTSWDDAANWDIGAVPGPNSDVVLTNTANVTAAMCVPVRVKSLTVDEGATLKLTPNGAYSTYEKPQVAEKFAETDWQPIALQVAGDLVVNGTFEIGGKFSLATFDLAVGGKLAFGEGAKGSFFAAYRASEKFFAVPNSRYETNETSMAEAAEYVDGGRVTVGGEMSVATNAVVAPWCDILSGASVRFDVGSLRVAAGGKIDANGKGWGYTSYSAVTYSFCPTLRDGGTGGYAGGTYAGEGGYANSHSPSHNVYGWALAPILPGGPGFNTWQAPGGGVVRVHATGPIRCYGTVSAIGASSASNGDGYSGAGGGIFLTGSRVKTDETTVITAEGCTVAGDSNHGAGGGGRVAIGERLNAAQLAELYQSGTLTGANAKHVTIDILDGPDAPLARHAQGVVTAKGGANNRIKPEEPDRRFFGEDGTVRWISGSKLGLTLIVR